MSARDPSGLPNGPTGSSRRRLLAIFSPTRIVAAGRSQSQRSRQYPDRARESPDTGHPAASADRSGVRVAVPRSPFFYRRRIAVDLAVTGHAHMLGGEEYPPT